MNKKPFYKGILPKDQDEILSIFRIESIHDIAAMLCQVPEEDLWNLIREILLALRSRVATKQDENPMQRATEYLYALVRFIEIAKRFPNKEEQGELLEELTDQKTIREDRLVPGLETILRKASESPKSRKARRQLQERSRKYRG